MPRDRPPQSSQEDIVTISKSVESSGPTVVAGSVRIRLATVDGRSSFSCNYGLQQKFDTSNAVPGIDNNYIVDPNPYYIVAGSNNVLPISSNQTTVQAPPQGDLNNAGGTVSTGDANPFTNFPEATSSEPRDPLFVWNQNYNN